MVSDFRPEGAEHGTAGGGHFLTARAVVRAVGVAEGGALAHGYVVLVEGQLAPVEPSAEGEICCEDG